MFCDSSVGDRRINKESGCSGLGCKQHESGFPRYSEYVSQHKRPDRTYRQGSGKTRNHKRDCRKAKRGISINALQKERRQRGNGTNRCQPSLTKKTEEVSSRANHGTDCIVTANLPVFRGFPPNQHNQRFRDMTHGHNHSCKCQQPPQVLGELHSMSFRKKAFNIPSRSSWPVGILVCSSHKTASNEESAQGILHTTYSNRIFS